MPFKALYEPTPQQILTIRIVQAHQVAQTHGLKYRCFTP